MVNTSLKAIFRTSDTIDGLLPVTGCRRRPWVAPPWQKAGDYYLTRAEERGYLERLRREYRGDAVLGLAARAAALYRHEPTRLIVGGAEGATIHTPKLLDGMAVFIDLTADYGAEDATRFIGSTLWTRIVRAALSRPVGSAPCFMLADEFQQLLQSEQDAALALENVLRLCGGRGVW